MYKVGEVDARISSRSLLNAAQLIGVKVVISYGVVLKSTADGFFDQFT